jgi:hypothetical protein
LLTEGQKAFPTKINIHNKYAASAMDGNKNFLTQIRNNYSFLAVTREKDLPIYIQSKPASVPFSLLPVKVSNFYKNGYTEFIPLNTALRLT